MLPHHPRCRPLLPFAAVVRAAVISCLRCVHRRCRCDCHPSSMLNCFKLSRPLLSALSSTDAICCCCLRCRRKLSLLCPLPPQLLLPSVVGAQSFCYHCSHLHYFFIFFAIIASSSASSFGCLYFFIRSSIKRAVRSNAFRFAYRAGCGEGKGVFGGGGWLGWIVSLGRNWVGCGIGDPNQNGGIGRRLLRQENHFWGVFPNYQRFDT